jgi:hypothetical protein
VEMARIELTHRKDTEKLATFKRWSVTGNNTKTGMARSLSALPAIKKRVSVQEGNVMYELAPRSQSTDETTLFSSVSSMSETGTETASDTTSSSTTSSTTSLTTTALSPSTAQLPSISIASVKPQRASSPQFQGRVQEMTAEGDESTSSSSSSSSSSKNRKTGFIENLSTERQSHPPTKSPSTRAISMGGGDLASHFNATTPTATTTTTSSHQQQQQHQQRSSSLDRHGSDTGHRESLVDIKTSVNMRYIYILTQLFVVVVVVVVICVKIITATYIYNIYNIYIYIYIYKDEVNRRSNQPY